MRCTLLFFFTMMTMTGQPPASDALTGESMLAEIRAVRLELRNGAALLPRVLLTMYRLVMQEVLLERAKQRSSQAQMECRSLEQQREMAAAQLEQAKKEGNAANIKAAELQFQTSAQASAGQSQQCHAEQMEADAQLRTEQAKMSELEQQLAKLDQVLAGNGGQ